MRRGNNRETQGERFVEDENTPADLFFFAARNTAGFSDRIRTVVTFSHSLNEQVSVWANRTVRT